ncbi:MAG: tRNA uridine-5-carboxymethylaminomethyl(34) synthesis GTPase MnmE [Bacteroidetes bacterium]|nr:tRNA uridine-5-carboxymethylaminomethyl(34) synthesis GTPase MnmE [Bacteroidota bacterium]MDA0859489.1 tRNA uridine-5-carboxymethylaminomethyl(34) synthesis GTPase MnmE [Bacteroidota bacterium]MDA1317924.1 tRNA uridine-5-carboxymethylaminomethyl(34) synthesis GTPase MnmE [Bacteroidota bacterium]
MTHNDTIIALATASGAGAIAVLRVSGAEALSISNSLFKSIHNKQLIDQPTHTVHLGHIIDGERVLDEVLVSIFKNPQSYTGEDVVEISCHGSSYIQQEILQLFIRKGCRAANAGEFTLRAFLNGKMDLSQAEAVADLIASDSAAAHQIALQQMRGGFSSEIKNLRQELLNFASLIELELDFSEEDVEFADRQQFEELLERIVKVLKYLIDSFSTGNVIKNGVPIAIVGAPNVGKSTLLNALLNEEKAIVSTIAGTTRDAIEDEISIEGIKFRFIDTAGIRQTNDTVEAIGIEKTFEKMAQSQVVLQLFDGSKISDETYSDIKNQIEQNLSQYPDKQQLIVVNKMDTSNLKTVEKCFEQFDYLMISAKTGDGVETLKKQLLGLVQMGKLHNNDTIITNARHYDALRQALDNIQKVQYGLQTRLSGDLLAIDIREALHHFGRITGEISTDDLLGNIFANFCIGK